MKKPFLKILAPFFGLCLFSLASVVLYHQLHAYHLHDILAHVRETASERVWEALLLTVASYSTMTGYDFLALRYLRRSVGFGKTALASFLGYAFSNNIGFSMIAGASIRYRLYTAWGLSAVEVTQIVLFCTTSLWLGFFMLSGALFVMEPVALPRSLHWPFATVRPLGVFLLAVAAVYIGFSLKGKREFKLKDWEFSLPSWRLAAGQMAVAALDWLLAGSVLYSLLPPQGHMGFWHFLEIFLVAQLGGLVSQTPGGLGVFESIILLLAPGDMPVPQLLGAMVVYRGLYYLLPLVTAIVALGLEELIQRKSLFDRIRSMTMATLEGLFIPLLSLAVFVAGAILLFSGALPALPHRLARLGGVLPLPVIEISHFLGSLAGMGLLLLARGLQRRLDVAYVLTAGLLATGMAASLMKGFDYEEASILLLALVVLVPCRRLFYRRASLLSESFGPGWLAAIAVVAISSVWLGLFSFRHVEYSNELWWHFSLKGEAPRFLRASVGALALALGFATARLLGPARYKPSKSEYAVPREAAEIVEKSPDASSNLALLGDKVFLFDSNRRAFIMYGVSGETWVSMGDPVGPVEYWPELLWQFRTESDRYAKRAVFYEVGSEHLHFYVDLGMNLLKLGEEARVPLASFSLEGGSRKNLRYIHNKLSKIGCTFEIVPQERSSGILDQLKTISDAWLEEKNTREKGFSLGFFDENYIRRFPVCVVRYQDCVVAFANIWSGAGQEELSIDLMRYLPGAPGGIMDFLFIELMLWGREQGYRWFNLGMAPLSGMQNHELAPLWHRMGKLVVRFGDHFYNFEGLRAYKEKFDPVWRPKYLAAPGGLSLARTLADIGGLISGGIKGVFLK